MLSLIRRLGGSWFAIVLTLAAMVAPTRGAEYRLLKIDGAHLKWGAPVLGAGAEVSYGFAMKRRSFPDAINCRALAPMVVLAPVWGGDPSRLHAIVAAALAMWSGKADIRFRRAGPGEAPDILIGAQGVPERVAFANVTHGPIGARRHRAPDKRRRLPQSAGDLEHRSRGTRAARTSMTSGR